MKASPFIVSPLIMSAIVSAGEGQSACAEPGGGNNGRGAPACAPSQATL